MPQEKDPIVIVEALRTPMGSFQSAFQKLSAVDLATVTVRGMLHMTELHKGAVSEVIMGNVLGAGLKQAPARQVALRAGLPDMTNATTVNKVCGSGMKAVMMGASQILTGESSVVIAGGMESMSNAPLFIKRPPKKTPPPAEPHYEDHLFYDGLFDAYASKTPMGMFAEATAEKYGFSREDQDAFTIHSVEKAQKATKERLFEREIVPIQLKSADTVENFDVDEPVQRAKLDKIPELKPVFKPDGTITAANASGLTDGAAALMLMRESEAAKHGLAPRARIVGYTSAGLEPKWFTLAPIEATKKLFEKIGWHGKDVDLYEVNEAFAVVAMAAMKDLHIVPEKFNVHGGACALGHPLGASGARVLVTLLNALEALNLKRGVASLCIGGGEGVAMAIERP